MSTKTNAAARNLAAAVEELEQAGDAVTDDDRELMRFAAEHLQPLLVIRNADTPGVLPGDDNLIDQAMASWDEQAKRGRQRYPDDFSFGIGQPLD